MAGRNTKLTPEIIKILADSIEAGLTHKLACQAANVGQSTLYLWKSIGDEQESGLERDLVDAIEEAEAKLAKQCVDMVRLAGLDDWKAAAWMLERRLGYRAQSSIEVSGPDGKAIEINAWSDLAKAAES